ncbi:MAG: phosphoribosylformylglycinamidine cyclo-ligase [Candidatus Heimdallarchaeota archaeon]|nr:phosphoribosylformylglycinamidine cyclo-ligase [Candidatus Heimdallarchaeota archaeon]
MTQNKEIPSTYAEAGIDLSLEGQILKTINNYVKKSFQFGDVVAREGHYANMIRLGDLGLALTSDGVGTKLLIAQDVGKLDSIGIDCVAMNVNDLLSMGIPPKAFVDYLAVSELNESQIEQIIAGIYKGCEMSEIPLLGGELATVPEMLVDKKNAFDVAGTALGIVSLDKVIDGSKVKPGDSVIGISSSGLHSNGFTIVRKILSIKYLLTESFPWERVVYEELLEPTRIYVKAILDLIKKCSVSGLAHITGGGFKKLFRLTSYGFELSDFPKPLNIFEEIRTLGKISFQEMFSVFNMGIGFVVVVPQEEEKTALQILNQYFESYKIGQVTKDPIVSIPEYEVLFVR